MHQQAHSTVRFLYPILDVVLVFIFAYYSPVLTDAISPILGWSQVSEANILLYNPLLACFALVFVPIILHVVGFYHRANLQRCSTAFRQIILFAIYYLCAVAFYQTLRSHDVGFNRVMLVNMVGVPCVVYLRFLLVRTIKLYALRSPEHLRQIILAGTREQIDEGWRKLPNYWKRCFHVVGEAVTGQTDVNKIQGIIEEHAVSHLLLLGGLSSYQQNEAVVHLCELQGIDIYICRSEHRTVTFRSEVNEVEGMRMIVLSFSPPYTWARMIKNILDFVIAAVLLILSSPIWFIAAIGIKISDPKGSVFFRQQRSGLHGRAFGMWKFRSMYTNAEERLAEVKKQHGNEMKAPLFKLTNDPRIFPFGHFIRKFSIDELPQLLNILLGDMSIVGPRPLAVYETQGMPDIAHRRRMSVKPGLTCYWQIEDRSTAEDSYDKMISKDLKYIDNWSLWLDVVLFFRTIPAVLLGKGAK